MEKTKDFTTGGVLKSLIRFAIPVLAALFLQSLYGAELLQGVERKLLFWAGYAIIL